jgi:hypothetical protein
MGPLSKPAQVAPHHNLRTESIKFAMSSGNPTFEGEGDAFSRKRTQRNVGSPKPKRRSQNSPKALATPRLKARVKLSLGKELKKCMLAEASMSHQKTTKVQSQCVRVTLLGEPIHINHSFGSSGLNLACEGLLLGMRKGGHKEIPMKPHHAHMTFTHIMIDNTFVIHFAGSDSLAQRRCASDLCQYHDCQHLRHLSCRKG